MDARISTDLLTRVLAKLGVGSGLSLDLDGLNRIYAAYSSKVPNDNIRKRIWLSGDRTALPAGAEPIDFFENWLAHGTGGTCFPSNGALCALLCQIGFDARRISGGVLLDGIEHDANHGSVIVRSAGVDYLVDAQLASFSALPLVPGRAASTGRGIHDISAIPLATSFDVHWYPGANRQRSLIMRPDLARGPVGHDYFVAQYILSTSSERKRSPFNDALFIGRHFPDSILIVSRNTRTRVAQDNTVDRREVSPAERKQVLIEEFGISEEIVDAIPPDEAQPG